MGGWVVRGGWGWVRVGEGCVRGGWVVRGV